MREFFQHTDFTVPTLDVIDQANEILLSSPPTIEGLIDDAIMEIVNVDDWEDAKEEERENRDRLTTISERWSEVVELIEDDEEE